MGPQRNDGYQWERPGAVGSINLCRGDACVARFVNTARQTTHRPRLSNHPDTRTPNRRWRRFTPIMPGRTTGRLNQTVPFSHGGPGPESGFFLLFHGPRRIFRVLRPTGRIVVNVLTDAVQVGLITNDLFVIIALPDRFAPGAADRVDAFGHGRFNRNRQWNRRTVQVGPMEDIAKAAQAPRPRGRR